MNKSLHDIDDLFRSGLEGYEEAPSKGLKEDLMAALDKKDAESYKKRFIGWKRTSLLLLLLLSGILLYDFGVLKTRNSSSGKQINLSTENKQASVDQNNTITNNTKNDKQPVNDDVNNTGNTVAADEKIITQNEQKIISGSAITGARNEVGSVKKFLADKLTLKKNNSFYKSADPFAVAVKKENGLIPSYPDENNFLTGNEDFQTKRMNAYQWPYKISFVKIITGLPNNIKQLLLPAAIDSLSKNKIEKNKKITAFTPFWMITSFASYERAGYRLDSDLPNNITSIKHSEIHEPSFSLGLLATRQFKRHWSVQSGIIYSQTDIGISPQKLHALQDPGGNITFKYVTSSGYAYIKPGSGTPPVLGDSITTKEGKHSLKSVSIPVILKYVVGKNKFTFTPGAGIEAGFLTGARVETEFESPTNSEIIVLNKLAGTKVFHAAIVADAELRYKLNNKLSVSFRPAIRLAISPITKSNTVETFPRSAGAGIGLAYKF